MNQGGIEDKYIPGKKNPILKLMDLDGDNDLDLLYGSTVEDASNTGTDSFYKLTAHRYDSENKRLLRIDREAKTEGSLANYVIENITDMQVGKINDDEYVDVIINTYDVDGEKDLYIYLGKENTNNYGEASMALVYDRIKLGDGLYNSKLKISDINNDGVLEIIQIGLTSENTTSGIPKLYIYNYEENTNQDGVSSGSFVQKDISDQISKLTDSSFDIGDYDNDQDIDLIITGFDVSNGLSTVIYNNVTIPGSNDYQFDSTQNQLGASRGGSINFFDMEILMLLLLAQALMEMFLKSMKIKSMKTYLIGKNSKPISQGLDRAKLILVISMEMAIMIYFSLVFSQVLEKFPS